MPSVSLYGIIKPMQDTIKVKKCCTCKQIKSLDDFYHWKNGIDKHTRRCKYCTNIINTAYRRKYKDKTNANNRKQYHKHKERFRATNLKYERKRRKLAKEGNKIIHAEILLKQIKARAKRKNLPINIDITDIIIPDVCPILGIPLVMSDKSSLPASASVDRIIPEKGYIKGNVLVISLKANLIKTNATPSEILKVWQFYSSLQNAAFRA